MYEKTVGDTNPAKKLIKHVASEYDIYVIYHQIALYQRHLTFLRRERTDKVLSGDEREQNKREAVAIKKDITRMRTWLKINDTRPKIFWNPNRETD